MKTWCRRASAAFRLRTAISRIGKGWAAARISPARRWLPPQRSAAASSMSGSLLREGRAMKPVKLIAGTAAPLMVENISTDVISPGLLYRTVNVDYARGMFGPWRYHKDGSDNPAFVLNQPRYRDTRILVAGRNFGCGSSREIAVWCIQRYGIGCVIAPSFGEIFYENAFQNGLVALELPETQVNDLAAELGSEDRAPRAAVDLAAKTVTCPSGRQIAFDMDEVRRTALLEGLAELRMILREEASIAEFQARGRAERPWQFPTPHPAQEG